MGDSMRDTQTGFNSTTSDKLFKAQSKLKTQKSVGEKDPDRKIKKMEEELNEIIDQSSLFFYDKKPIEALNKAKEAQQKMRVFEKYLKTNDLSDLLNVELYFSVGMNLATMFEKNKLFQEALSEYSKLLDMKAHDNTFLVRVNMGNIYFQQEQYSMAIKMYKMALDMAPAKFGMIKFKLMKNIGHAYVKKKEFLEAISVYEDIINKYPDFESAFNLILCLYTIGDKEKLKRSFVEMLNIETYWNDDKADNDQEEEKSNEDPLLAELSLRRNKEISYITDSAKLIAPIIEDNILDGYEWLIETLKNSKYSEIQPELEISRALVHVKNKNIEVAIDSLKSFEKKDKRMMTLASTNLGFLYLLEKDFENAEKYCDMALNNDRYNSKALVNKGNCYFYKNDFLRAKENYLEAIGVEADCIEALYNLAFVNKKINAFGEALTALEKLQSIISTAPEVLYQMANIYELVGDNKNALKWYDLLHSTLPNDPNINAKIGMLYSLEKDEAQAYYHYLESFKQLPVNLDTIAWLGIYFVRNLNYEKACFFFERASLIQPKDNKWNLMIASCNRRMGKMDKALSLYEEIYNEDPDNLESLRFIVQICQELGRDCEEYQISLRKLERELEAIEGGFVNFQADNLEERPVGESDEGYNAPMENRLVKKD